MTEKSKLRFLLALGGQRIVVLNKNAYTHLYTQPAVTRQNVSASRLYTAIQTK